MEKRIFTIAMILLLSLSMLAVLHIHTVKANTNVDLPDNELLTYFDEGWGWGNLPLPNYTKSDESGLGVRFSFTGLTGSGKAICDGYELNAAAGGTDLHNANFTKYTHYRMLFRNVGTTNLTVNLFMNTGFTSGWPDPLDTYWECAWTDITAGESKIVTLDFSSAIVHNAADDPVYKQYPDGTPGVAMWRLTEVTKIGFQVLQNSGDGTGTLVVSGIDATTWLHMNPSTTKKTYSDVASFFDVFVSIESVTGLYGFDIEVMWDESLVKLHDREYVPELQTIWEDPVHAPDYSASFTNTTAGKCKLVATSLNKTFTGSADLLKLTFEVKDPDTNSIKEASLKFGTHKLSDIDSIPIVHACADGLYVISGKKPTLSTKNTAGTGYTRTCMVYDEEFNVKLIVSDAANVTDFTFEVRYDKTCVSYHDVVWGALGSGSISDDGNGKITGSVGPATAQSDTVTLVTIVFHSIVQRMWKNIAGWTNDVNSAIYIQTADLTYASPAPKLNYTRSNPRDPAQITVGSDFACTFSPIKGDLNNDGLVDIADLSAVAAKYDSYDATYNLVGTDTYVDIFDLVIVASNYWYIYSYPGP